MQPLQADQRFERYRVIRHLGQGSTGDSYEAEDLYLPRTVTLKLLHPWSRLSDSARRQFFRELQGMSAITHPHLATILDYGERDGQLYIVRQYVALGSLLSSEGRRWYSPPLDITHAIQFVHQLAQVLQHIHDYGYIHGSLTLSNILLQYSPNLHNEPAPLLLADMGTAHFVRRFGQAQKAVVPITTSPEQFVKRVTTASDQYALAILFYFWLAGQPPFLGTPEEIEQKKLTGTITALSSLNPHVTEAQVAIVQRALRIYPEERFPSIMAFAEALAATHSPGAITVQLPIVKQEQTPETPSILIQPIPPAPLPGPEIVPIPPVPLPSTPGPEPIPLPQPTPEVEPEPEPSPQPEPEILPTPEPDIAQPLPDTTPIPKPSPPDEPTKNTGPIEHEIRYAYLTITSPYIEGTREVTLERSEITLGRAGSSDILLDHDPLTSRHHALLKLEGECYVIYDQRSAYGVKINGQSLADGIGHTLDDNDQIDIGEYTLTFHFGKPRISSEVSEPGTEHVLHQ